MTGLGLRQGNDRSRSGTSGSRRTGRSPYLADEQRGGLSSLLEAYIGSKNRAKRLEAVTGDA